eukprot:765269-Hanusia_phi.AAC.8
MEQKPCIFYRRFRTVTDGQDLGSGFCTCAQVKVNESAGQSQLYRQVLENISRLVQEQHRSRAWGSAGRLALDLSSDLQPSLYDSPASIL